jgi:hypothetical protein
MENKTCPRCNGSKPSQDFYAGDRTCKECRKAAVRKNRADKLEYYRSYDAMRFQRDQYRRQANDARAATPEGRERAKRYRAKWLANNQEKRAAHSLVQYALKSGKLVKPDTCEDCGSPPYGKKGLHAHHDDYLRPLEVNWLCPKCHVSRHNGSPKPIPQNTIEKGEK